MMTSEIVTRPTRDPIHNPVRDGAALLTPDVLRAIDLLARKRVGAVIEVRPQDDMRGCWGRLQHLAGDVCLDVRRLRDGGLAPAMANLRTLDIAPMISTAQFRGAIRPEIDLDHVPENRIFEFVALHEIGHVCDNFETRLFAARHLPNLPEDPRWDRAIHKLNEILADRFAWNTMFPGRPVPVLASCESIGAWATDWSAALVADGLRRGLQKPPRVIDADPLTFVPASYLRKGIPWAKPWIRDELRAAPDWLRSLRLARIDYREYKLRNFAQLAADMAALWQDVARHPTQRAMNLASAGRISELLQGA